MKYYILVHNLQEEVSSSQISNAFTLQLEQDVNTRCIQAANVLPQDERTTFCRRGSLIKLKSDLYVGSVLHARFSTVTQNALFISL